MYNTIETWQNEFEQYLLKQNNDDKAHDVSHVRRVWKTAQRIMLVHAADHLVVLTACYFHDIVSLMKNDPRRSMASAMSAEKVGYILQYEIKNFPQDLLPKIQHAILAHSFSAAITPETIEAKIVQDADRMEALGAIGIARVFYTAGKLNSQLFNADDPLALHRELNDQVFALDHFQQKLLKLHNTMQTNEGQRIARAYTAYLQQYLKTIADEIKGEGLPSAQL